MWGIPRVYWKKVKIEEYLLDELKSALGIENDTDAIGEAIRLAMEVQETLLLQSEIERLPPFHENWEQDQDAWKGDSRSSERD